MKKRALALLLALSMAFGSPAYLSAAEQGGGPSVKQEEVQGEEEDPSDPDSGKGQTKEGGNTDTGEGTGQETDGEIQDPLQPENDPPVFETEYPTLEEKAPAVQTNTPGEEAGQDPESLFSVYVDNAFSGNKGSAPGKKLMAAKKTTTGEKLTGVAAVVYAKIARGLPDIAAGEEDSTVFTISPAEAGLDKVRWSAEDLGVARVGAQDNDGNWKIS